MTIDILSTIISIAAGLLMALLIINAIHMWRFLADWKYWKDQIIKMRDDQKALHKSVSDIYYRIKRLEEKGINR